MKPVRPEHIQTMLTNAGLDFKSRFDRAADGSGKPDVLSIYRADNTATYIHLEQDDTGWSVHWSDYAPKGPRIFMNHESASQNTLTGIKLELARLLFLAKLIDSRKFESMVLSGPLSVHALDVAFGSDEAIGIEHCECDGRGEPLRDDLGSLILIDPSSSRFNEVQSVSVLPDGSKAIVCTNIARAIQRKLAQYGHASIVVGYDENPSSDMVDTEGGHDFLLVGHPDRPFLVDGWLRSVTDRKVQVAFDLTDERDRKSAHIRYGQHDKWQPVPSHESPWQPSRPMIGLRQFDELARIKSLLVESGIVLDLRYAASDPQRLHDHRIEIFLPTGEKTPVHIEVNTLFDSTYKVHRDEDPTLGGENDMVAHSDITTGVEATASELVRALRAARVIAPHAGEALTKSTPQVSPPRVRPR